MGIGTLVTAFVAGVLCTLALQVWRAKATGSSAIGPVVSALTAAVGSPVATSAQAWVDAAWLQIMAETKAVIDKEFAAAQVPTPTIPPTNPPAPGA